MAKNQVKLILLLLLIFFGSCRPKKKEAELIWDSTFPRIGSQSSPRAVNLNGDDVLDFVMGAGLNEYQPSDKGIIALDGKTGQLLWQQKASDQVYGSATFYDVDGDGIKDVFIGGRSPQFKALSGKNGQVIWEFDATKHENDPILKNARFNFNNSILVPDQNGDGLLDLLTANGGNSKANPNSEENRFPGVLMIIDSKTGNIIAADTMPDGKESYMSPISLKQAGQNDPTIIFGSGGETISGNLYAAKLSDLLNQKLSNARVIASETGHGFIAPPTIADITNDGYPDIVAISHGSTAFAVDGKAHSLLWKKRIENSECSNSFAVGYFTDDDVPDFFTFVSKGQWPNSTGSLQVMLDGKDGELRYIDSLGCTGFSSPVVYDINGDGVDEAIISINEYDCSLGFAGKSPNVMKSKLIAVNFRNHSFQTIDESPDFKNVFSTPWIGDIDSDGYLDIVHCQYYHRGSILAFLGMRLKRIDTSVKISKDVVWGAYMGSNGESTFLK
jgi:outer membrane protein assembly factor BamB